MTTPLPDQPAQVTPPMHDCWRHVGTGGDRTCPELARFIHCRNCPVVAAAARRFFDRPAPPGYLDAWRDLLEAPEAAPATDARSILVFRIGAEWLGVATSAVAQVVPARRVHRMPHRATGSLAGIVNIQGQLHPCVRLERVLGMGGPASTAVDGAPMARMLVLDGDHDRGGSRWVIPVDEVAGISNVAPASLRSLPSTVGGSIDRATEALFSWQGRTVGLLDERRMFASLHAAVAK